MAELKFQIFLYYSNHRDITSYKQPQIAKITKFNSYTIILVTNISEKCKYCTLAHANTYKSKLAIIIIIVNEIMNMDGHMSMTIVL